MKTHITELLAPAGNRESLYAAVTAGADAVYLGAEQFNARRGADNFTLETLEQACDYAHLRGVLVYLTLNTVVLPDELDEALELARQAYRCGIDGVIVQDIGLISELIRTLPELPVHASTQMNTHSEAGVEALAALGVKRITFARELHVAEIARLATVARAHGMEAEVFVHGALCVCYSGQCFMSSMIGGRSANRGLCAQACRLPYELRNKALRKPCSSPGNHLLSPKDLCLIDEIEALKEAGVISFKIEGRMKSPDYVHTVTSIYRKALGRADEADQKTSSEDSDKNSASDQDKRLLGEVFSRGFTTAYLGGERGNEIMSYTRPNNRGVLVGRVDSTSKGSVDLVLEDEIAEGDVLEVWTSKGNFTHTVTADEARSSRKATLVVARSAKKGDRVFRVRREALSFEGNNLHPKVVIIGSARLRIGEPLTISVSTEIGSYQAIFEGEIVEAARTKAVSAEEVKAHVNRLGSTPFELADMTVELDEGVGISFSTIHKARAHVLERLQENMLAPYKNRVLKRTEKRLLPAVYQAKGCDVAVLATNPTCARAARKAGADLIYVPALFYKRGEAVIAGQLSQTAEQAGYPKKSIVALPEVEHDAEEGTREQTRDFDVWQFVRAGKPVLVENLGQLYKARELGAQPEAGPHIPVTNAVSLATIEKAGATRAWLSPELSLEQIAKLAHQSPVPLGITITGAQKLMTTEHCLLMSQGPCNEECATCPRRKSPHYVKDRKGYEFPILTDLCGRSHLYNAVSLDNAHAAADLIRAGVSALMVDTTLMNAAETTKSVARAVRARDIALSGDNHVGKAEGLTTGHLFRGVQ